MIDSRDNSTPTQHNQFKRGPIFDTVADRFRTVLHPSKWRALDESLLPGEATCHSANIFQVNVHALKSNSSCSVMPPLDIYLG